MPTKLSLKKMIKSCFGFPFIGLTLRRARMFALAIFNALSESIPSTQQRRISKEWEEINQTATRSYQNLRVD
jgi:hypothetical protein